MRRLILLTSLFVFCVEVTGQPGAFDFSFGKNGIVRSGIGFNVRISSSAQHVLPLSNGSMYVISKNRDLTRRYEETYKRLLLRI